MGEKQLADITGKIANSLYEKYKIYKKTWLKDDIEKYFSKYQIKKLVSPFPLMVPHFCIFNV